jgi:hypothetical protein
VATDEFVYDQRLIDPRVTLPPLSRRLPALVHTSSERGLFQSPD